MKHTRAKVFAVVLTTLFLTSSLLLRSEVVVSSATLPQNINNCINLEFEQEGVLPSSQGFTYTASSAGVSETSVFSVSGGLLHLNTLGTGAAAYYQLPNAYDPSQDFTLEIRMKVFPETGIFGVDFEVSDNVTDYEFGFDSSGIRLPPPPNSRPFFPFDATDGFHTYKVFSPGGTRAYHFFIDGVLVASNSVSGGDPGGRLVFGDGTASGGDGRADIDYIRYCQTTPVCVSPPSGMVSWWPGDGNANDIADGNDGTLVNGATFAPGMVGPAFSLDGTDDAVETPDAPNLNPTQQITLDAWVYPTATSGDPDVVNMIVNKEEFFPTGTIAQYELGRKNTGDCSPDAGIPTGNLAFFLGGVTGLPTQCRGWIDGGAFLPLDTWSHVALTFDGAAVRAYVNGVLSRELPAGGTLATTNGELRIGARSVVQVQNSRWAGRIDEVEIYNRALAASEIQGIFSAGSGGKCKNVTVPQLSALGEANVWLGLKNSDDVGTKFDLLAEVFRNGSPVGSGQLNNVPGGSSGFNNAVLRTIDLALTSSVGISAGDTLSIRLSVRIAVGVTGHRSGTARLWFNDAAANSRFGATIGGVTSDHFLRDGFTLVTIAGPGPKKTIDVFVDRAVGGNPFKPFGTWSKTF